MPHALTVKGQVTIPKAMRDHMKVSQGQELEFVAQPKSMKILGVYPAHKFRKKF